MAETMRNADVESASHELRGPLLAATASLVLAFSCLMDWADVQIAVFNRSYTGMHFGEGNLTLGLLVAVAASAALLAASLLAVADRLRREPWTSRTESEVQ